MRKDIFETKILKLTNLKKLGFDPYPEKTRRNCANAQVLDNFETLKKKKEIVLVGRVRSLRIMGKAFFAHIEDGTAKIQVFFSREDMKKTETYKILVENLEIGDIIEVSGKLFKTKTGEKTLKAYGWQMLAKNLSPLPLEHFGLRNKEILLRQRYLDLILNPETRKLFHQKSIFWSSIRQFLEKEGFLEVDTPALESIPGGADARPFITHHNALNRDYYLRISLELPLKRLLVGGLEKVFEIGKVFRNEGIDNEHLQDYLQMEFYWAYADMQKGMELVERMYKEIVLRTVGSEALSSFREGGFNLVTLYQKHKINWSDPWLVLDYFEEFEKKTGLKLQENTSLEELKKKAQDLGLTFEKSYGKGRLIDLIFKKAVRPDIIQPSFLVGHPIEISPLAKKDPARPGRVLRFQVIAGGSELGNGFSELNDPVDQQERFQEQARLREAGDEEAQMMDNDFIEALKYGMPPAVGFGLSERLFAFLMNRPVRETVLFPPMKEK